MNDVTRRNTEHSSRSAKVFAHTLFIKENVLGS